MNSTIKCLRETSPLVHHLTNYVTVNDCANVTLAIGASPVMGHFSDDSQGLTSIASSLVINMGTPDEEFVEGMKASCKVANERNIPIVFDPVGVGATKYRNQVAEEFLQGFKAAVIKGNISEIMNLAGLDVRTKGVDAVATDMKREDVVKMAKEIANKLETVVAITGAADIITDGDIAVAISNGVKEMGMITGCGCMTASLVASFAGALPLETLEDYMPSNLKFIMESSKSNELKRNLLAGVMGVSVMGISGETAYEEAGKLGTGSLRVSLIDDVSKINDAKWVEQVKIERV